MEDMSTQMQSNLIETELDQIAIEEMTVEQDICYQMRRFIEEDLQIVEPFMTEVEAEADIRLEIEEEVHPEVEDHRLVEKKI